MAKLRKMLGDVNQPEIVRLMRMIETQSKETLAKWAVDCAEERYLDIYEKDAFGKIYIRTPEIWKREERHMGRSARCGIA